MHSTRPTLKDLAQNLASAMPDLGPTEQRIATTLYRLLAAGRPVSSQKLAGRLDVSPDLVRSTLKRWPGVFYDDNKNIVGFWGLALPETGHRFGVDGKQLYNWCAYDSLFIPEILGITARIESFCPVTGKRISLVVSPDRVEEVSPSSVVVSFLTPETPFDENMVMSFCHYVHFFSSEKAGNKWIADHEGTFLFSVEEAFNLAKLTNSGKFGNALTRNE